MKTLVLELPAQAALRFEALEQAHGKRLQKLLEQIVLKVLERVELAPDAEMHALEETLATSELADEEEFDAIVNYLMDKNAELYRRLA